MFCGYLVHFVSLHCNLLIVGLCPCLKALSYTDLFFMAGVDVEHGHWAVGGAVTRHELLSAHVWGV